LEGASLIELPTVLDVRKRVEKVQREDIRIFLQSLYLLGAARSYELTGRNCPNDSTHKKVIYGPRGTDATETIYQPTELTATQAALIISGQIDPKQALQPVKIALFRVSIAKRQLGEDEQTKSRLVALPLDERFEPWTQPIYKYFKTKGSDYVFPFTRQEAWRWITKKEPIFKGLTYPIQTYRVKKTGETEKTIIAMHPRKFKLHALRHLRVNELIENYEFDGLDYAAYVGWSLTTAPNNLSSSPTPPMLRVYGTDIYEKWRRYAKKLLKERTW
jgi:hypothetical protein